MVVTITRDSSLSWDIGDIGWFEGLYGGVFGIIAGPTGICLSKQNHLSQTQCLWKVFITFIFFTMMGSIAGFVLNIFMITSPPESDFYTALIFVQFTLLIGKDFFFYFLMKHVFSSFDCFHLGFLELWLFKMSVSQSIVRTNTSRKCYRCSKEQWHHL